MSILRKHLWEGLESIEKVNELEFLVELGYLQKSVVYEVTFDLIDYRPVYDFKDYIIYRNKIIQEYVGRKLEPSEEKRIKDDITTAIKEKGKGRDGLDSLWRGFIVYSILRIGAPAAVGWDVSKNEWYYYNYVECFKVRNIRFKSGEPKSNTQVKEAAKGTPDFKRFINVLEKKGYELVGIKPGGELSDIDPQKDYALLVSWLETFVLDYYLKNFVEGVPQ
jgi:hypothetical protein